MGLALKDSPPGFDPTSVVDDYGTDDDDDQGYAETEQLLGCSEPSQPSRLLTHLEESNTMPTPTKGPRLGGGPAHERLMLANLATALFEHGRITTTEAKAKRLRPLAERLITLAKRGDLHARRQVLTVVRDKGVVHTLFTEIGPRYENRPGGYTRITKIGPRKGDNAPMAVIELVEALHRRAAGASARPSAPRGPSGRGQGQAGCRPRRDGGRGPRPRSPTRRGCVEADEADARRAATEVAAPRPRPAEADADAARGRRRGGRAEQRRGGPERTGRGRGLSATPPATPTSTSRT